MYDIYFFAQKNKIAIILNRKLVIVFFLGGGDINLKQCYTCFYA